VAQSFRRHPRRPSPRRGVLSRYFPAGSRRAHRGGPDPRPNAGQGQDRASVARPASRRSPSRWTKDGRTFLQATMTPPPDSQGRLHAWWTRSGPRYTPFPGGGRPRVGGGDPRSTRTWRTAAAHGPGPATFPLILGVVLLILGLLFACDRSPASCLIATVGAVVRPPAPRHLPALFFKHVFRLRGRGYRDAAVRLRVLGGARHRLQQSFLMTRVRRSRSGPGTRRGGAHRPGR